MASIITFIAFRLGRARLGEGFGAAERTFSRSIVEIANAKVQSIKTRFKMALLF
jgi:hypothetical protein